MQKILLNKAQQTAVDYIYGPMLVLAGPGTGKTQLLSARIANILEKTDANAQNILCLTFTESAAQNMRERLSSMIGPDAYDVHIATYHGFGSDVIRSYPEFFENIDLETGQDSRLEKPIDDLQRIQITESILKKLPFDSPLIGAKHYIKNLSSTISEIKRALYTPDSLSTLASGNIKCVETISPKISDTLKGIKRFPGQAAKSIELFSQILAILDGDHSLVEMAREDLELALSEAADIGKSKPLTAWKNQWLKKDSNDNFIFTDIKVHMRMIELAKVFREYQKQLDDKSLYDFDDMILRSINGLKTKDELRFNLQEKYQFILLDEFQDTNAAQFELVAQLADNPVNEGQPNIFAVGDDDQAIYAFQGARVSNMLKFTNSYRDVAIVNLTENYRSHPDIIHSAHNIAGQIESRLHHNLKGINKTLEASATNLPENAIIARHEFAAAANEYAWIANEISELITKGTSPSEISVLAPKHKLLENMVPFLSKLDVPIAYEKRENILQTPLVESFKMMIQLVLAVQNDDGGAINNLMPKVLSLEFYQIPVKDIWQTNWAYRTREDERSWVEVAMDNETLAPHVLAYLSIGLKSSHEPLEYILDYLTGSGTIELDENTTYTSPLKEYYFSHRETDQLKYYESLANLSTIREHLRAYQNGAENLLTSNDFLDFINAYESADQPLINTHPIAQAEESIQLMTAYKAKGLEFEHVFLLSVHDDVWGKKARGGNNKVTLPANLQHARYQGSSEDELRRILFVAVTRAKQGLYLTSHANKDNGKSTEPVKYLLESSSGGTRKVGVLPADKQEVTQTKFNGEQTMQNIELLWESRHVNLTAELKSLLQPRLDNYQMSPTHLNSFIDTEYGGPETFLLNTLLRFPQAPGEDGEFGSAIHAALEQYQRAIIKNGKASIDTLIKDFEKLIEKRYIPQERIEDFKARGRKALKLYADARTDMFSRVAQPEVDFKKEGVLIDGALLSGKIDRLEIDKKSKTVRIIDFKTGKTHTKWERKVKLLKYKQQLYFYKFLIEGSHTWQTYKVSEARLEFVEPDENGNIAPPLTIEFDVEEERQMKQLIKSVWDKIKTLNLPSTIEFSPDYRGTQSFIETLLI